VSGERTADVTHVLLLLSAATPPKYRDRSSVPTDVEPPSPRWQETTPHVQREVAKFIVSKYHQIYPNNSQNILSVDGSQIGDRPHVLENHHEKMSFFCHFVILIR
jgi:hypothetical protein